jgi:hypothetical protein
MTPRCWHLTCLLCGLEDTNLTEPGSPMQQAERSHERTEDHRAIAEERCQIAEEER